MIKIKPLLVLIFGLILISFSNSFAQDFSIKTNSLEIINNKLVVSYDFIDFKKNDKFEVWVVVTDGYGNKLTAKTFSGDVGMNITGGVDKKITWDYMYDHIVINDEIGIEVKAEKMSLQEVTIQEMTVVKTSFRSAVFPGWGLAKITGNKTHLISGAVTYLSAGAGVYYMLESQKNYDEYQAGNLTSGESDFYKKSIDQNTMSKAFFIGAGSIWAANIVWTAIKTKKLKNEQKAKQAYFFPVYNKTTDIKGISFIYTF